eukprot:3140420-Prymnesium_polylepis.2
MRLPTGWCDGPCARAPIHARTHRFGTRCLHPACLPHAARQGLDGARLAAAARPLAGTLAADAGATEPANSCALNRAHAAVR